MQISTYLPIVLDILDNNPQLKEVVPARSLQCAYLAEGRIGDAKTVNVEEGYHGIPVELFDEIEEGTVLSYEVVGRLMHVSNKKVREILGDVITIVAIRHLESLQVKAE